MLLAILAAGALAAWWSWRRGLVHPEPGRPDAPREGPAAELVAGPGWPILLLAGLLIWLAQALGAGSAVTLLGLSGADALTLRGMALTALGGYTGSIAAAAVTALTVPGLVRTIGVRARWADARSGAAGFVLILPIVLAVGVVASTAAAWIAGLLGTPPPSELAHATLRLLAAPGPGEGLWSALTIVAVVLGAPIAEEVIYRGHLQTGLRLAFGPGSAARWGAVVLTSMLFALMHAGIADLHALPTLLVLSIGLGIAYERTGSLAVPACIHALFNAANIALAWLPG